MTNNNQIDHLELLKEILPVPSKEEGADRFSAKNTAAQEASCRATCSGSCVSGFV